MSLLRRWGVWVVLALVAVAALVIGASRPAPAGLAARTRVLAEQVRCPVCQGESVEQSQVPAAVTIRTQISAELGAGIAPSTVLADLARSYPGTSLLEKPPAKGIGLVVWVLPVVVAAAGAGGLAVAIVRWRRRPATERLDRATDPLDPAAGGSGSGPGPVAGSGAGAGPAPGWRGPAPDEDLVARALASAREARR